MTEATFTEDIVPHLPLRGVNIGRLTFSAILISTVNENLMAGRARRESEVIGRPVGAGDLIQGLRFAPWFDQSLLAPFHLDLVAALWK